MSDAPGHSGTGLLVIYIREGCHLCEEAMEAIGRVYDEVSRTLSTPLPSIDLRDVDADQAVAELFGNDVPVVVLNDKIVFKHRIHADRLRTLLEAETRNPV